MHQKQIGKTDLTVTDISFGCAGIGNIGRAISDQEAEDVLQAAWDAGIRYFDTAPHYGRGRSEERLGSFLKNRDRSSFAISTKVGRVLSPGLALSEADGFVDPLPNSVRYDYSGAGFEEAFEQSCQRLQTDTIDILYVHDIGAYTHGPDNDRHMKDFFASGLDKLQELKASGRIQAYGLGVNETHVCLDILTRTDLDAILLAGRLTLLDRDAEAELVAICQKRATSLILGGIFNSGILATGPTEGAWFDYKPASQDIIEQVTDLQRKTETLGIPLATAALHYAHSHPAAASVLIGTGKISSLKRNLAALETPIPTGCQELFGY